MNWSGPRTRREDGIILGHTPNPIQLGTFGKAWIRSALTHSLERETLRPADGFVTAPDISILRQHWICTAKQFLRTPKTYTIRSTINTNVPR